MQDRDASCQKLTRGSVPSSTGQHTTRRLSPGTSHACRTWPQAGAPSSWPQAAVHCTHGCPCDDVPGSQLCWYLHQAGGGPAATPRSMRASRKRPLVAKSRAPGVATYAWAAVGRCDSSASGSTRGLTAPRLQRSRLGLMNVLDLSRAPAHFGVQSMRRQDGLSKRCGCPPRQWRSAPIRGTLRSATARTPRVGECATV